MQHYRQFIYLNSSKAYQNSDYILNNFGAVIVAPVIIYLI